MVADPAASNTNVGSSTTRMEEEEEEEDEAVDDVMSRRRVLVDWQHPFFPAAASSLLQLALLRGPRAGGALAMLPRGA